MRVPDAADRDFTASAFVVDDGRVLLIRHAKLGRWLQPGGHVEPRETPDEAAVREVREETGVTMRIHDDWQPAAVSSGAADLPQPFRINLHQVRPDHWHCDFAFLGLVVEHGRRRDTDEHDGQGWFSPAEAADLERIDDYTRRMVTAAVDATDGSR